MLDLLFTNAAIADGSGGPCRKANVGVQNGLIAYIGDEFPEAARVIELSDEEVLCPGFIDSHAHSELYMYYDPSMRPKLLQGVTTEVSGNCGIGMAPVAPETFPYLKQYVGTAAAGIKAPEQWESYATFRAFLEAAADLHAGISEAFYVAHGALRIAVKGFDPSPLTEEESERMDALLREAMEAGAIGMTTGLVYAPGSNATNEEIWHLLKIVKEYDGIYASHIRSEGEFVIESVRETIEAARRTGVRTIISHHKVTGIRLEHLIPEVHRLVREAREEGLKVYLDHYPYSAGASTLTTTIPYRYTAGGFEEMIRRFDDPRTLEKIRYEILHNDGTWQNPLDSTGFEGIVIIGSPEDRSLEGKNLREIAELWDIEPVDTIFRLLRINHGQVMVLLYFMREEAVEMILRSPLVSICTDSLLYAEEYRVHPRGYATYPRMLGHYVRERGVLDLETAVRKMTSMPADMLGMTGKGRIEEGKDADIVVFNRNTIIDRGSYEDPRAENPGIAWVVVNGIVAVDHGSITCGSAGKVLINRSGTVS
ncbi:MAG: D-aminoacylase [Lachnospiraceae bacterium]|nr:D-aminoacylase [Lachnospiraceae bacterium]